VQLGQEILATDWYTCYLSIQKGGGTASLVDASGIVDDARYPTPSALSSRSAGSSSRYRGYAVLDITRH